MERKERGLTAYRDAPTSTEKALAALVSSAGTRVHIDLSAEQGAVAGVYFPDKDCIYLFRPQGNVPAVCVALEEAGHSLHRQDYLDNADRIVRVRMGLEAWMSGASHLLDWLEDARVYRALKRDYPGAAEDLDYVWDLREEHVASLAFDLASSTAQPAKEQLTRQHRLASEYLQIARDYKAGKSFETLPEILDYLEQFLHERPPDPPVPDPTAVLVAGLAGDQGERRLTGLRFVRAGDSLPIPVLVSVEFGDLAGLGLDGGDYDWPVLGIDVIDVSTLAGGEDWEAM